MLVFKNPSASPWTVTDSDDPFRALTVNLAKHLFLFSSHFTDYFPVVPPLAVYKLNALLSIMFAPIIALWVIILVLLQTILYSFDDNFCPLSES